MYKRPTRPAPDQFVDLMNREHEKQRKKIVKAYEGYIERYETSQPFQQALQVIRDEIKAVESLKRIREESQNNEDLVVNIKVAEKVSEHLKSILNKLEPKKIKKILDNNS